MKIGAEELFYRRLIPNFMDTFPSNDEESFRIHLYIFSTHIHKKKVDYSILMQTQYIDNCFQLID